MVTVVSSGKYLACDQLERDGERTTTAAGWGEAGGDILSRYHLLSATARAGLPGPVVTQSPHSWSRVNVDTQRQTILDNLISSAPRPVPALSHPIVIQVQN